MIKRNILIGLCVFFLGLSTSTYAADTEVVLDTADSTSGFTVKDLSLNDIFRVGGDGNVGVNGTLQIKLPFPSTGIKPFRITIGSADKFLIDNEGRVMSLFKVGVTGFKADTGGNIEVNSIKFKDGQTSRFGNIFYLDLKSYPIGRNGMEIKKQPGSNGKLLKISSDTATGDFLTVDGNGDVGIGTTNPTNPLEMGSGALVTSGGVWTDASSRDYKENIENLSVDNALKTLEGLKPVTFKYKAEESEKYVGFIAEDVPELVATQDRKGLSPMDITAVLTKVVQEQQKIISELSAKVKSLEDRI